jgi:hypothetical protein
MAEGAFWRVLRNSRPARFVAWGLAWVFVAMASVVPFEWVKYHTEGHSTLLRIINPRCTRQFDHRCYELDMTNPPWEATVASWLAQVSWVLLIVFLVLAITGALVAAVLLLVNVIFPKDRETDVLSRLADSSWIGAGTGGWCWALTGLIGLGLVWEQWETLGAILIIAGGFLSAVASGWAGDWAGRYRHERFLAQEAKRQSEWDAQMSEADSD